MFLPVAEQKHRYASLVIYVLTLSSTAYQMSYVKGNDRSLGVDHIFVIGSDHNAVGEA